MSSYDDIIDLPHHVSETRQPMPMEKRAAQFSPFAALTGFEDVVDEEQRLTDSRHEADEERIARIDRCLNFLMQAEYSGIQVTAAYFRKDSRKEGGEYLVYTGEFRYIETSANVLIFADHTKIPVRDIFDITAEEFEE